MKSKVMKDYRKEEAAIFDAMKKELSENGILGFVEDGIVDPQSWEEAKVKCLLLLKEPVGKLNEHFSLTSFVRDGAKKNVDKTWRNVARWIYSIFNTETSHPYNEIKAIGNTAQSRKEYLKYITVVNLKKQSGGSVTSTVDLKEQFENRFKSEFSQLMDKLNSEKNISIIKGITDESENLRVDALNDIHKFIELKQESSPEIKPIIKEANVSIKEILTSSKVRIESEDDLNDFFKKVETKVRAELENNNIVNLKF